MIIGPMRIGLWLGFYNPLKPTGPTMYVIEFCHTPLWVTEKEARKMSFVCRYDMLKNSENEQINIADTRHYTLFKDSVRYTKALFGKVLQPEIKVSDFFNFLNARLIDTPNSGNHWPETCELKLGIAVYLKDESLINAVKTEIDMMLASLDETKFRSRPHYGRTKRTWKNNLYKFMLDREAFMTAVEQQASDPKIKALKRGKFIIDKVEPFSYVPRQFHIKKSFLQRISSIFFAEKKPGVKLSPTEFPETRLFILVLEQLDGAVELFVNSRIEYAFKDGWFHSLQPFMDLNVKQPLKCRYRYKCNLNADCRHNIVDTLNEDPGSIYYFRNYALVHNGRTVLKVTSNTSFEIDESICIPLKLINFAAEWNIKVAKSSNIQL